MLYACMTLKWTQIFYKVFLKTSLIINKSHTVVYNVWASTQPPNPNPALLFLASEIRHVTYKQKHRLSRAKNIECITFWKGNYSVVWGQEGGRRDATQITYKTICDLNKNQNDFFFWSLYC